MNGHRFTALQGITRQAKSLGTLSLVAGFAMVAVGCKEPQERVLRMDVELGTVTAKPIGLPNGTTVNFPEVAKDLFYRQVMNHDHFNIVANTDSTTGGAAVSAKVSAKAVGTKSAIADLGTDDLALLKKYGMLNRLQVAAAPKSVSGKVSAKAIANSSAVPACVYERPLAKLGTNVLSFAANFGAGLKLGYDSAGGISLGSPVGASIDFSSSKMDLTVRWDDNFTKQTVAAAEGISYSGDTKFSIGLGSFPIGVDFFYKTPLADVVKSAFTAGLDQAVQQYITKTAGPGKTWNDAWEARVISDPLIDNDNFVAFRSGTYAGVMKGDKFTVRNQTYRWMDESNPCGSALKYTLPDGETVAELEVTESSSLITIAKVKVLADGAIRPGAQVKILSLIQPLTEEEAAAQQALAQQ